ncbi:2-oxoglutarate-acceptor oxidoreductase subunit OorD [Campylobacter geochelonis]|uniref:2-oxoglutarate-acceptor oxidoreductase subunit OorD n=2 Tax=Campylobacter geochelonis TaxID=1780362 RepID=A0A128EQP9_9BACT|nr:2-oxoglutarate:acceptor oxidoreductase, delta subunit [Campylobacter geochelonis]CZE48001.1 2-oxoglutarate-acceptor oxidoreductase subunit OorD [Campylobacter geochelonis]CZE48245.1 2-oxoglutarate-acceptor oxidoreductase subunit OorD [Campylobacter geochelonis]CZE51039.1 2-oxoglutarate-acceptor oxidoreductase subunit OorD [Campylobacter geochelonis]
MIEQPKDAAVWVDESRCKACNICVDYCPSGTLAMRYDPYSIQGMMIEVLDSNSCIGCRDCETHCPDFAIYVADKGFKFAKLTEESKKRAEAIKSNNYMELKESV